MAINKKTLEYLAELSRIDLDNKNEEKDLKDIQEILNYFEELKEVDTENITDISIQNLKNIFREDDSETSLRNLDMKKREKLINQFIEKEKGFLKIPPVFE
ncbi:Asp-tRNA(Asn)/Glu-tRNA(Gln) amidotransferase subunit GatC [Candidatus Wolfebacteria bacterium]|nr:Asp-tRNA(Asn)/Glu-tRNA(Gln) amidotransferase subunit GatC [Candidatus Wolfebacteria bacterium]